MTTNSEPRFGPSSWEKLTDEDRTLLDTVKPEDFKILNTVMARLWRGGPLSEPELVLEVIDKTSPYVGVLFNVHNFEVLPVTLQNGMVPVKFSVRVYHHPVGFEHNEMFDDYARSVYIAWLAYIQTHDYRVVTQVPVSGSTH